MEVVVGVLVGAGLGIEENQAVEEGRLLGEWDSTTSDSLPSQRYVSNIELCMCVQTLLALLTSEALQSTLHLYSISCFRKSTGEGLKKSGLELARVVPRM